MTAAELALAIKCPVCKAPKGEPCRAKKPHGKRIGMAGYWAGKAPTVRAPAKKAGPPSEPWWHAHYPQ